MVLGATAIFHDSTTFQMQIQTVDKVLSDAKARYLSLHGPAVTLFGFVSIRYYKLRDQNEFGILHIFNPEERQ